MKHSIVIIVSALAAFFLGTQYYYYSPPLYKKTYKATAVIHPTKGNTCSGVVYFTHEKDGLKIVADIYGLSEGLHGFHIHEYGDCACDDAVCAGGHFNPTDQLHGGPDAAQRHAGDFGNLKAGKDGHAHYEQIDTVATLNGPHSIIGRAAIIHAQEDDLTSQPTGNAGARVGCGVVGIGKD
ncbi:MAG: superoxide dismutase family protein [Candidatus Babeliales bacterium]